MKTIQVTLPLMGLVAVSRVAIGVGIGLLLADRLMPPQRRSAGWTLLTLGGLSTIPLVAKIFLAEQPDEEALRVRGDPVGPFVTADSFE